MDFTSIPMSSPGMTWRWAFSITVHEFYLPTTRRHGENSLAEPFLCPEDNRVSALQSSSFPSPLSKVCLEPEEEIIPHEPCAMKNLSHP